MDMNEDNAGVGIQVPRGRFKGTLSCGCGMEAWKPPNAPQLSLRLALRHISCAPSLFSLVLAFAFVRHAFSGKLYFGETLYVSIFPSASVRLPFFVPPQALTSFLILEV